MDADHPLCSRRITLLERHAARLVYRSFFDANRYRRILEYLVARRILFRADVCLNIASPYVWIGIALQEAWDRWTHMAIDSHDDHWTPLDHECHPYYSIPFTDVMGIAVLSSYTAISPSFATRVYRT